MHENQAEYQSSKIPSSEYRFFASDLVYLEEMKQYTVPLDVEGLGFIACD
jgi:hypothetical protein